MLTPPWVIETGTGLEDDAEGTARSVWWSMPSEALLTNRSLSTWSLSLGVAPPKRRREKRVGATHLGGETPSYGRRLWDDLPRGGHQHWRCSESREALGS